MPHNTNSFFKDRHIIIATHYSATGFTQHLEEFLCEEKVKKLLYISHPLHPEKGGRGVSFYRFTKGGKTKEVVQFSFLRNNGVITYFKDLILNVFWVIKEGRGWNLYIGADNLNAFSGILLKSLGFVNKVVFYTVDFVPNRFKNKLLNSFYHWIEKLAVMYSDEVWVLSPRVLEGRRMFLGLDKKYDEKQKLVPEGVWIDRIKKISFSDINKHSAVFAGHLVKRMGVQLVIEAIPLILAKIPDFTFFIIGKGEYRDVLGRLAKRRGVEKHVIFKGYIGDHRDVENIIASCGVGIATYTKEDESGLTFYADPAKTKLYLGAGIPVIMTDTFYNACDIQNGGAGIVVKEGAKEVARAILATIENDKILEQYRVNSRKFARQFDHAKLFTENLRRVLK